MSELEKMLKDIVYGGVGAVASVLETGSGLAKTFVEKGQKIVQQAKPAAEDWSRKIKAVCDEAVEKTGVDISELSREQREQLAALMTKLNKVEDAAAKAMKDFVEDLKQNGTDSAASADEADMADEAGAVDVADEAEPAEAPDIVVDMPEAGSADDTIPGDEDDDSNG